jgi:hypothetical protein
VIAAAQRVGRRQSRRPSATSRRTAPATSDRRPDRGGRPSTQAFRRLDVEEPASCRDRLREDEPRAPRPRRRRRRLHQDRALARARADPAEPPFRDGPNPKIDFAATARSTSTHGSPSCLRGPTGAPRRAGRQLARHRRHQRARDARAAAGRRARQHRAVRSRCCWCRREARRHLAARPRRLREPAQPDPIFHSPTPHSR